MSAAIAAGRGRFGDRRWMRRAAMAALLSVVGTLSVLGGVPTAPAGAVPNQPPVADAGFGQDVGGGQLVTVDGSASTDPDGDDTIVSYAWTQTAGPAITLADPSAATTTFTAPAGPATIELTLTVTDDLGESDTDTASIVVNAVPVANAGSDQTVASGRTAYLLGFGSNDADGPITSYSWSQDSGPPVTISAATSPMATFTSPIGPATLTFTLTVTDDFDQTDTDTVTITVNGPPTANAGADRTAAPGENVFVGGAGSDPERGFLTYSWTQTSGPTVQLNSTSTAFTSFTAPEGPATIELTVEVTDDYDQKATDSVTITVNGPPVAAAGADQHVLPGELVTLSGTASTDPDDEELLYAWSHDAGDEITLSSTTAPQTTFTAPDGPATITLTLTVTDEIGQVGTDTVTVTVDGPPVPDAGPDRVVNPGLVFFNGTGSDPDGDELTYSWVQTGGPTVEILYPQTFSLAFEAPDTATPLTFALTVSDGDESDTDSVTVTVNQAPVAVAGPDQNADRQDTITLDGSGSSDPEGESISYSWMQTAGPMVPLVGADTATPSFTAPGGPGQVLLELTVVDPMGRVGKDTVTVELNREPVADAGADQRVEAGDVVTVDGTASADPDGDPLTYAWAQWGGPVIDLSDPTAATPTFVAPDVAGTVLLVLTVTDDDGLTGTDSVSIVINGRPTAAAGDDQTVDPGDGVTLVGIGSTDPDWDALRYQWTQTYGPPVTLDGARTAHATFTAPTGPAELRFRLIVRDPGGRFHTDFVTVFVNGTPHADAGPDQTADTGSTVTLTGSGWRTGLRYQWTQTYGPTVAITGERSATATFTAPAHPTELRFRLIIRDEAGRSARDFVTVVVGGPPVANAGPDQIVTRGETVSLDGSGSTPGVRYQWTQTYGPAVTLSSATAAAPTFTAPDVTTTRDLRFRLIVRDKQGRFTADFVTISVRPAEA